jgi:hypothetical protein
MSITFVSSIFFVNDNDRQPIHSNEWTLNTQIIHLTLLASTEVPLCVFIAKEYEYLKEHFSLYPNISLFFIESLTETWIYTTVNEYEYEYSIQNGSDQTASPSIQLPTHRNKEKDTYEYLLYSYTKYECMEKAITSNPWNTTHFAWIDLPSIGLFARKEDSLRYLKWMNELRMKPGFIAFPGCWNKIDKNKIEELTDRVHWRFCGGFYIGDMYSVGSFCQLFKETFPLFLKKYGKLTWDFNYLAYMEIEYEDRWKPTWYKGDHNENILGISSAHYTHPISITPMTVKKEYNYPMIPSYYPTSAAYLCHNGRHILNTRYVNYWIYPNGCYLFHSGKRLIENKNMLCVLDDATLEPIKFKEIEEYVPLPIKEDCLSRGLEDIRLYEFEGKVKYIATTMGYNVDGKSRMIIGNYDIERGRIDEGHIIYSPEETWCEKNWIPIIHKGKEMFIYKWNPIEIGTILEEKMEENADGTQKSMRYRLKIEIRIENKMPLANKIRGSSIFQETEEGWMGVVHYSEEHSPRQYFHMLVVLDKETLEPVKWSHPFCFEKLGIEFCIGFYLCKQLANMQDKCMEVENKIDQNETHYVFWISRHDRDPIMMWINKNEIIW